MCIRDRDTAYLKYTGNHYFTYSNPEVLAVLASAPYFEDLLNRDDLSGNYAESTTSYAKKMCIRDSLYIAQVKQKYGIIERENYNPKTPSSPDARRRRKRQLRRHCVTLG